MHDIMHMCTQWPLFSAAACCRCRGDSWERACISIFLKKAGNVCDSVRVCVCVCVHNCNLNQYL